MRLLPLLLLVPPLAGCLTVSAVSTTVDRLPAGRETVLDAAPTRLVATEGGEGASGGDGTVGLVVSTARRELDLERWDVVETRTERRDWRKGGRAARDVLLVASAAVALVGAIGVSYETEDGRTIQVGGLGSDAITWQGVTALLAAVGGAGTGVQQTLATRRPGATTSALLRSEQVVRATRYVPDAPLAAGLLTLTVGDGNPFSRPTDPAGHAAVPAASLPTAAWTAGVDLVAGDLRGAWTPSEALRQDLLARPLDGSAPFYASLLGDLSDLAALAREGASAAGSPPPPGLPDPPTPAALQAHLQTLPPEARLPQVRAWTDALTPLAEAAEARREAVHLDWLRTSAQVARQSGAAVAGVLAAQGDVPPDLLTPLFAPFDLFRQLPDDVTVPVPSLAHPDPAGHPAGVVLLEAGPCAADPAPGPPGRALVTCDGVPLLVVSDAPLPLAGARAWVVAGLVDAPVGVVAPGGASTWVATVRPLYAASAGLSPTGTPTFGQVLDEPALQASGVLRRLGE